MVGDFNEILLNGKVEEEVKQFYHVHCFTDQKGPDIDNPDLYFFIPKSVCRVVDEWTIAVQDWYVKKKNLAAFTRDPGRRVLTRSNLPSKRKPKG